MIPAEPVGPVVARGEAEIGFQQVSELKPIAGIVLVGPLPPELQKITIFSAGIVVGASEPEAARALIAFLASPSAAAAIRESGMEPMTSAAPSELSGSVMIVLQAAFYGNRIQRSLTRSHYCSLSRIAP